MKDVYFDVIMTVERLHRLFLDVVSAELDRLNIQDVNSIQCFILYNIGDRELTVGEISNRGYYLGSNVTYNLKKMVEMGYLIQTQSAHDRRSSHVRLSDKGRFLVERFDQIMEGHASNLKHNQLPEPEMKALKNTLQRLEQFWSFTQNHTIRF